MVEWFEVVNSFTGGLYTALWVGLLLLFSGLIVWTIITILKYNIKFRVREVVGGKTRIIDDKAKEIKDSEGVLKWKLFKRRHIVPVPPKDAVHLTHRGKYSVEAYYLPEGEYKYVLDNGVDTDKLINFEPLDTADREFYASEMREAESYRKKKWLDYVMPLAGGFMILSVFVLMLVFWEDIAQPAITIQSSAAGIAEDQRATMEIMRDIIQDRQVIQNIELPSDSSQNVTGGGGS